MNLFDSVKHKLSEIIKNIPVFDPSSLNDELALKTEWGSISKVRSNFGTQKLVQVTPARLEFHIRKVAFVLPGLLTAAGVWIAYKSAADSLGNGDSNLMPGILIGVGFVAVAVFLLRIFMTPRVFDKTAGRYWKGRVQPGLASADNNKNSCELRQIHAIQLIKLSMGSDGGDEGDGSSKTYELNLVLTDASRINVQCHGSLGLIRSDAELLGKFLGIPVWDAILKR